MSASTTIPPGWAGGWLTIDLGAIVANWRMLAGRTAGAECAAVVKANAYGLGIEAVAPALAQAGCRSFFVAHLSEGATLRTVLGAGPRIFVLNGVPPSMDEEFLARSLLPVLNSPGQIASWQACARARGHALAAAIQIDTGMSRFGLAADEVARLAGAPDGFAGIETVLVMSHLGCADDPAHPANAAQLANFARTRPLLPAAPSSLAASSGIFLGPGFHFDLVRPGAALYGVPPTAERPNPMRPVIRLQGRVAQLRHVPKGASVGYGAKFMTGRPSRIATVAVGYADGFLRAGGGKAHASLPAGGPLLPIVGRISMDCLAIDVTDAPDPDLREGMPVDLIGPLHPLEEAADAAGTIGYELLTALGARYHRHYLPSQP